MARLYKLILAIAFVLAPTNVFAAWDKGDNHTYTFSAITGGGSGSLDSLSGVCIGALDRSIVQTGVTFYFYEVFDSGTTVGVESSPYRIVPDDLQSGGDGITGTSTWSLATISGDTIEARSAGIGTLSATTPLLSLIDLPEVAIVPDDPDTNRLRIYTEAIKGFSFLKYLDDGGMKRAFLRDSVIVVRNERGSTIAANRIVYASGSTTEVPLVDAAKADSITTLPAIGITIESIADDAYGRVMQVGLLENVNTAALAEGDVLYVSDSTAGVPTTTAPISPSLTQEIGTVLVSDAVVGAIQIVARGLTGDEYGTAQDNFRFGSGVNPHTIVDSTAGVCTFQVGFNDGTKMTTAPSFPLSGVSLDFDATGGTTLSGVSAVIIEANIFNPDDVQSSVSENVGIFLVDADKWPDGIIIDSIWTQQFGATAYTVIVEEWTGGNPSHDNDIESMVIAAGTFYEETVSGNIDHRVVEGGNWIFLDLPTTESDQLFVKLKGRTR